VLPSTRDLLAFAGRFLLVFFLLLPLWFVVTPAYNRLLASSANIVLPLTENPRIHTLVGWKNNIAIVRSDTSVAAGTKIQGFTGYLTHFNLILMSALVLASRRIDWQRRCAILAIALGLLFFIHVLYLVVGVKFFQQPELEALQDPAGRLVVWGTNFYLSMASQLLPIVIWMALYRIELPMLGQRSGVEAGPTVDETQEKKERKRKRR
jgi:hypothetical protein